LLDSRYPFLSAYLKGEEAKIVTADLIGSMSTASRLQDVLEVIKGTDVGSYLEGTLINTFDDVDEQLWMYFNGCLERLEWFKPVPADMLKIIEAYIAKYDVSNIKAALHSISSGKQTHKIPVGVIHSCGLLDDLSRAQNEDSVIRILNSCKLGAYASIVEEYQVNGNVESRLRVEARLDDEYYKNLLKVAHGVQDGSILANTFGTIIDMTNLQVILRAIITGVNIGAAEYTISGGYMISEALIKGLFSLDLSDIPGRLAITQYRDVAAEVVAGYESGRNVAIVNEVIERHKFKLVRDVLSPRILSPLMVAWYLILKETEIRNLRLILKAVLDNMLVEEVKDFLVLA
jgi:vacuolar-type H+-ATPase subunit C/Vma6